MRTVIFGVDGLSFRILRPLIERGDLPNFARLQREGATAEFISTAFPVTPSAWMSMVTGLKPAKHGVFDFWEFDALSAHRRAKAVTHRKAGKAIWNILSEYGKRVIVMNVPVTYPPEIINGVMVSGLMTPDISSPYTYPQLFKEELQKVIPDYRIDVPKNTAVTQYFDSVLYMTEKRIQLQEHLLSEHEWDFAFLCYIGADRIQHHDWDYIAEMSQEATRYYRLIDDALGRVLRRLTQEDVLFVVSDHGFVGAKQQFYINEYLHRKKFLQYSATFDRNRAKSLGIAREIARKTNMMGVARKAQETFASFFGKKTPAAKIGDLYHPTLEAVDFDVSHAYVLTPTSFSGGGTDIFLSPEASPQDIEELRQLIHAERHPETGEPLVQALYATDAFGFGPFRPPEEHLILLPSPGITFHLDVARPHLWETREKSVGVHEKEGIFYAWGSDITQGIQVDPLQIYDLVPTALHALNITVDEPFDGHVAQSIFVQKRDEMGGRASEDSPVLRRLRQLKEAKAEE